MTVGADDVPDCMMLALPQFGSFSRHGLLRLYLTFLDPRVGAAHQTGIAASRIAREREVTHRSGVEVEHATTPCAQHDAPPSSCDNPSASRWIVNFIGARAPVQAR